MAGYVLLVGAKSAMARAIAHRFAQEGFHLYLAGRGRAELEQEAADMRIRHQVQAQVVEMDLMAFDTLEGIYASLEPKPEVVICVAGFMPEQPAAERSLNLAVQTAGLNYTGAAWLLNVAANDMEQRKSGSIIGISSVAGDRGRASNYWYGSAKAGFTAFLSGLRNRMSFHNVHVLTVKPGFVYTAMTAHLKLPAPLTAQPEQVAADVFRAWKKKKNVLYTKWMWRWIMCIIRSVPEWKFKKMKL